MLCGERASIVERLRARFAEAPRAMGLDGGTVVEIWAGPAGSWTILRTDVRGVSCILALGEAFELLPEPIPEDRL